MFPTLQVAPSQLETERLILRVPTDSDGKLVYDTVIDSLPHLQPWMEFLKNPPTLEGTEMWTHDANVRHFQLEEFAFMLFRKSDGAFLGNTGIHNIDWDVPRFEIGYWLATPYEGHGYMAEAVNRLIAFTLDDLHAARLEIRCDARNRRSAAVAERTGFTLEARLRCNRRANDGTLADTLIFSRLAKPCESG